MTGRKSPDRSRQFSLVHVAPLGDLTAYTVFEHELDIIAAGSPANLAFNFAVALVSIGVSFVLTLTTTTITSDRLFVVYVVICVVSWIAGIFSFAYWLGTRTSVGVTVAKIKGRLAVTTPVQEPPATDPAAGP